MLLSMFWKAVCGESRTHGLEGAEEGRPSSATLQHKRFNPMLLNSKVYSTTPTSFDMILETLFR